MIFIVFGALPIAIAVGLGYIALWTSRKPHGAERAVPAE